MSSQPKEKRLSRFFKDLDFEDEESDEEDVEEIAEDTNRTESISNSKQSLTSKVTDEKADSVKDSSDHKTVNKAKESQTEKLQKLPSAHECLKTQTMPSFLKSLSRKDVDWDRLEKLLPSESDGSVPIDYKNNAVPPPSTYEPETDPGIKVVDSEGLKRKTAYDELEDQMTSTKAFKVHPLEETGS